MTFTVTPLVSSGYLVEGQDSKGVEDTTVLRSEAWDYVLHLRAHEVADEQFDADVKAFFAPIMEAADAHKAAVTKPANEWATVTFGKNVEGKQARTFELDEAGVILRILDETDGSSLRWVEGGLVAVL